MRHVMSLVVLALFATGCGDSGTTPSSQGGVEAPAGVTTWLFTYRAATSHTCPGPPQIPTDGGVVIMSVAPDGRTLALVGTTATTITIPLISNDGNGNWRREEPSPIAVGAFIRISFTFQTSRLAQGEMFASKTILADLSGNTCSATWPITLDRQ